MPRCSSAVLQAHDIETLTRPDRRMIPYMVALTLALGVLDLMFVVGDFGLAKVVRDAQQEGAVFARAVSVEPSRRQASVDRFRAELEQALAPYMGSNEFPREFQHEGATETGSRGAGRAVARRRLAEVSRGVVFLVVSGLRELA